MTAARSVGRTAAYRTTPYWTCWTPGERPGTDGRCPGPGGELPHHDELLRLPAGVPAVATGVAGVQTRATAEVVSESLEQRVAVLEGKDQQTGETEAKEAS